MNPFKRKAAGQSLAEDADRHVCYQLAVQDVVTEIDFVEETWGELRHRPLELLREDFCGTANTACEWVRRDANHRAIGVDLDGDVLEWGRQHNLSQLTDLQRERIRLVEADVTTGTDEAPDAVLAMNFSYFLLMERAQLGAYFRSVHDNLVADGIFFLDAYGGYDSHKEIVEEREIDDGGDGFHYIWEQAAFDPITHIMDCHIHFAFADGSELRNAFNYKWRLWTLPEVRDLLLESGFKKVTVYWQGWDRHGEPDGDFNPAKHAEADAGWICYLTAEK